MEDYLIDRGTLGKFVDELIKKKALAVENTDELNQLREETMKSLDDKISTSIIERLDDEQMSSYEQMLDDDTQTEDDFRRFFESIGVNVEDTMTNAMKEFGEEFLGGEDA